VRWLESTCNEKEWICSLKLAKTHWVDQFMTTMILQQFSEPESKKLTGKDFAVLALYIAEIYLV